MNTDILNQKGFAFILVSILMVTFGTQSISYAQAANPTITASVEAPLTEATLHGSAVTLTLSGAVYVDRILPGTVSVSGIDGVTQRISYIRRISDTKVTVGLSFFGDFDSDATLTFTVGAGAIAEYKGNALTATLPVTAIEESLTASTEAPLTEATLDGSIVTLTLIGLRFFDSEWDIGSRLSVSGIEGVTFDRVKGVVRVSDTEVTIELEFDGTDFDTDATLTFTYGYMFTTTLPVTAMQESLVASTESPLTETTLDGSVVTLTLSRGRFVDSGSRLRGAVSVSGIDGDVILRRSVERVNDTEVTIELGFAGNIDTDATLTFTVEAGAIVGYNGNALTATLPVTAVKESLEASTESPLTEATLHGSIITLTLSGAVYADWVFGGTVSVSGVEGVTFNWWDVERISDTELTVELTFSGDLDSKATLTFTVAAEAIAGGYDGPPLTAEVPVTPRQQLNATVSISPASVISPDVGKKLTFSLNIKGGENIAGYQATVLYNSNALDYVRSVNGDYLPMDAFFIPPIRKYTRERNRIALTLAASTLAGASNGDGTLATLTFEVEDFKSSTLTLSELYLVDADGTRWEVTTESAKVTIPPEPENAILADINRDGIVNIQDLVIVNARFGQRGPNSADINGDGVVNIVDLVLVAGAFKNGAAAPALHPQSLEILTAVDIQRWLSQAQQLELTDATSLKGILFLEQLFAALIPKETALLSNYPNPFNPETWIPYRLSKPADVTLTIYAVDGQMVRRLSLGHQPAGIYQSRSRAAYWDGKNEFGEPVASGVYFYTLSTESTRDSVTAGDFTATRKMLIRK